MPGCRGAREQGARWARPPSAVSGAVSEGHLVPPKIQVDSKIYIFRYPPISHFSSSSGLALQQTVAILARGVSKALIVYLSQSRMTVRTDARVRGRTQCRCGGQVFIAISSTEGGSRYVSRSTKPNCLLLVIATSYSIRVFGRIFA